MELLVGHYGVVLICNVSQMYHIKNIPDLKIFYGCNFAESPLTPSWPPSLVTWPSVGVVTGTHHWDLCHDYPTTAPVKWESLHRQVNIYNIYVCICICHPLCKNQAKV